MTTKAERLVLKQIEEKIEAAKALVKEAKDLADEAGVSFTFDISGEQTYDPGERGNAWEASNDCEGWSASGTGC